MGLNNLKKEKMVWLSWLVILLFVMGVLLESANAATVAGTTSRNSSRYDFNCIYTLKNDTANNRYTLEVTAQLKIIKYKFSTTKEHKVNIKINGTTYTKTLSGISGGDNATTVTKKLYTKAVNYPYASAARSIPISISTTDIESGGYGPGICKASTKASIPAVATTKTISGSVIWKDNNNQDGLRAARTITILRDGAAYKTVSSAGAWSTAVPIYKAAGGTSAYSITGNGLTGYTGPVISGYNLTYTRPTFYTTTVTGSIQWKDMNNLMKKRPETVVVKLIKGSTQVAQATVGQDQAGLWKYQFAGVPKYEGGKEIIYKVEQAAQEYETEYQGLNIINTYVPSFDVRLGFSI